MQIITKNLFIHRMKTLTIAIQKDILPLFKWYTMKKYKKQCIPFIKCTVFYLKFKLIDLIL
ncbi:hypothetical protein LBYS11_04660 [Lysinibacillus sp. YS11]|nr:hypothetical protein LBYS11_04660 [Lysinibacillus sp. YS11]KMN37146.1 hypothetical protein VK91_20015 [Lysinibacillus sp. LK3]OCX62851.1 hypothetical protein BFM98_14375 [Lysinibacillus sp. AR18-8]